MGRILCAWSPSWAIASWRRRRSAPSDSAAAPFALVETVRGVRRLAAVDEAAARLGLFAGQKATDALALAPELDLADAEPDQDARALEALVEWCVRFSPAVAVDPPDGLFLDIEGLAHLWGGEGELMADFRRSLAGAGIAVRLAVADTPGAAWAIAHFGPDGTLAAPGDQARHLEPLPPAALRLEPEVAAQIERLGLRRLAQLFPMPRAPFARRFGAAALSRLDHALGRVPGARRFELAFHRLDGRAEARTVGLSRAACDAARLARLFTPKLETVDPGFGIEAATLAAREVEPLTAHQARLDAEVEGDAADLAPLIDRLSNRLGEARVWTAAPVESHVPELAVARRPPFSPAPAAGWDPEAPRPVRLFRRPQPIEAMAPVPDDPPVQFRWRGQLHRIRRAEGPERVAEEWWKRPIEDADPARVRDYYRLEDQEGRRFWVFRAGLYEPGPPAKWWLHGVFG
jgi:protein ImuB